MSKSKVKLSFADVHVLWDFAKHIEVCSVIVETKTKVLTCYCAEEEISLAVEKYGAEVLQCKTQETTMSWLQH